jgi:hypothetical protein
LDLLCQSFFLRSPSWPVGCGKRAAFSKGCGRVPGGRVGGGSLPYPVRPPAGEMGVRGKRGSFPQAGKIHCASGLWAQCLTTCVRRAPGSRGVLLTWIRAELVEAGMEGCRAKLKARKAWRNRAPPTRRAGRRTTRPPNGPAGTAPRSADSQKRLPAGEPRECPAQLPLSRRGCIPAPTGRKIRCRWRSLLT